MPSNVVFNTLELPKTKGQVVHVSVAPGVYHGTLPTSSTQPHHPHCNLGAALVTRKDLVQAFDKQKARGDVTPARFRASCIYAPPPKRMKPFRQAGI